MSGDNLVKALEHGERNRNRISKREWVCPDCEHRIPRHHSTKERPFCDPCDWQHAVLIEMRPEKNGEKVDL